MKLTKETLLTLHDIEIRKDTKHFIVEDLKTQEFYEMPLVCIDALDLIRKGFNLGEIEEKLIKAYPNEEIDLVDFGEQLLELNLVHSVDDEEIKHKKEHNSKLGYEWIPSQLGRVFFNKYTNYLYGLLFIVNIGIFCFQPSLFPHYKDLFVFDILSLNIIVLGTLSLFTVIIHELGHILAVRSFGLPTRLEIGHRLYLIVFETDLSLAWKLPSKKRNILYLAGVCFDNAVLFVALMLQLFAPIQSNLLSGLIGLVVFDVIIRIVYQACIYMKTDFYFLFENLTGTYNLMENSIHAIKSLFSNSKVKNKELFHGEEKIVRSYSVFYIVGVGITLGLFFLYFLPQLLYMFIHILPGFTSPISDIYFWDAVLFSIQIFVIFGLLIYSYGKSHNKKNVEN
ncbi:hypothetical protein DZB84_17535 [Bacillus sp. HNG]|uniref:hypothetical protein n=1 Tax=Bacillus sp. HNG TaxID=2293325 RepID=UPI000E2FC23E|nr:hypothetical protein [Bacillus sp. HNG]RFB13430.1 hypothetical protein DZB84_17535 [Bacillus sp. HNG]